MANQRIKPHWIEDVNDDGNIYVLVPDGNGGFEPREYNSHEVTQTVSAGATATINVDTNEATGYVEGNASLVDEDQASGDSSLDIASNGTTTNGNGNLDGLSIYNVGADSADVTVRFSGVVE